MLNIQNSRGDSLPVSASQKLTIEVVSAIFGDDDILKGSSSLPISMGLSESVQRFLGGKYNYYSGEFVDIEVSVETQGLVLHQCLFSYRINQDKVQGYLKIDLGELTSTIKSTRLRDIVKDQVYLGKNGPEIAARMKTIAQAYPNEFPVTFFPVRNTNFFPKDYQPSGPTFAFGSSAYVNFYDPGTAKFVCDTSTTLDIISPNRPVVRIPQVGYPIVPFVYFRYLLQTACSFLGFKAVGSWIDSNETLRLCFDNNTSIALTKQYNDTLFLPQVFDVSPHVPNITISDFFKAIRSFFGLGIYVDSKLHEIRFEPLRETIRKTSYVELVNSTKGKINIDQKEENGIVVSNALEKDDIYKTIPVEKSFTVGKGERKVTLKIGTLPMEREYVQKNAFLSFWSVPTTLVASNLGGNFYADTDRYFKDTPANDCPLRLLMYHGFQPVLSGTQTYPMGSSVSVNVRSEKQAEYSLLPGEPDHIWDYYQKLYFQLQNNGRAVTSQHLLSLSSVLQLRPESVIGARLDGITLSKFLLHTLSYELPDVDGFVRARLKLVPLLPITVEPRNSNPVLSSNTYVELQMIDFSPEVSGNIETIFTTVVISFWTTPERDISQTVTNFPVVIREQSYESETGGAFQNDSTVICNGIQTTVLTRVVRKATTTSQDGVVSFFTTDFFLVPTNYYRII